MPVSFPACCFFFFVFSTYSREDSCLVVHTKDSEVFVVDSPTHTHTITHVVIPTLVTFLKVEKKGPGGRSAAFFRTLTGFNTRKVQQHYTESPRLLGCLRSKCVQILFFQGQNMTNSRVEPKFVKILNV